MFQGYYNMASAMITQNRNLNVISNNMANMLTPGYKRDIMISQTFAEVMMSRTGNLDRSNIEELNNAAMMRLVSENVTDYRQGGLEDTRNPLDFALLEDGFFQIQTQDGIQYTRNGAFIIDDEGYLSFPEMGRVLGLDGPIYVGTDEIKLDELGVIHNANTGEALGSFAIVTFENLEELEKTKSGLFATNQVGVPANVTIQQGVLEYSNVDAAEEMVAMIESQRALQSAAQILKIYDQLMNKASTEIARI